MSAAASFAFASAVPRARGPRDASTSAPPARVAGGASRSRRSAHRPRAAADVDVHHPHDAETSTAEDDLREGVTLELRVAVSRPLDASIVAARDGTTAEDFLASRAALDAVLSGGARATHHRRRPSPHLARQSPGVRRPPLFRRTQGGVQSRQRLPGHRRERARAGTEPAPDATAAPMRERRRT